MQHKFDSLVAHKIFHPEKLPPDRKAISLYWVYVHKFHADGSIIQGKEKA